MSSAALGGEIALRIRCHCQDTSFSLKLSKNFFPLKSAICHCHSCRHATGQLFATFAVIPTHVPDEIRGLRSEHLVSYNSSSTLSRLFCKKCGATVANIDNAGEEQEWELATGIIEFLDSDEGHQGKFNRVQLWVEDAKGDGGAAGWINVGRLAGMERHWTGRESENVSDEAVHEILAKADKEPQQHISQDAQLKVRCHCGNVSFRVNRPGKDYNQGTGKFGTGIDACTSCRLVTGFEITSWTTVPQNLIEPAGQDLDAYLSDRSKLKHYKSSSDVSRYFCSDCGATVFYQKHGLDTIDISIGVLSPEVSDVARAEDWLSWQKYPRGVAYQEDAVDRKFVDDLAEGYRLHQGEEVA